MLIFGSIYKNEIRKIQIFGEQQSINISDLVTIREKNVSSNKISDI